MSPHGLVIGKFYPPHAGHHLLVRAAAASCERVSVVVMAASHESIPLAARVRWMREVHAADRGVAVGGIVDDHAVDYADPRAWEAHVGLMREALRQMGSPPVTAVFTSEAYGEELARRFGARSVAVDPQRVLVPVSGARVRADPVACWEHLAPPVRAGLALRVVVVGAESTGSTTLALALAGRLRERGGAHGLTRWVPEYGREYTRQKLANARAAAQLRGAPPPGMEQLVWTSPEFAHIAATQSALEDREAALGGPVLVCDTDAFATGIWHERYVGCRSPEVERAADASPHALYLLTHDEGVPFEQDGLRDGESIRRWMTTRFVDALARTGRRHVVLTGDPGVRLRQALAACDALLAEGWRFAAPWPPR